jgi:VCBS repeat-containing protein
MFSAVAVVDSSLADMATLRSAIDVDAEVVCFNSQTDSAEDVIDSILASVDPDETLDSVSIFSHGREGEFQFGNERINKQTAWDHRQDWQRLAEHLVPGGNMYLFGCEVGAGLDGIDFLDALGELTGADVFASDDITGRGGDWDLEVASSGAEAELSAGLDLGLDAVPASGYEHRLAIGEFDTSADIGDVGAAGSAVETGGTYTVEASGDELWNEDDEFHFVYKEVTGDFDAVVRVVSVEDTHSWAKAGLMIRNTLDADSSYVAGLITPGNGAAHQNRGHQGAPTSRDWATENYFPRWVRIVRSGNTFKTYDSADGASWDLIGDYTQLMAETAYLGLAVNSYNDGMLCTAEFDSFDLGDTPVPVGDVYLGPVNQDIDEAAGALLANDTDPNGGPMTTVLDTDVSHGTLSLGDDGSFTYSPDVDFVGTDSFTYYVASGSFTSASVTVELDIYDDANTAPVITAPAEEVCYGQAVWFGSQTASGITIDDEDSGSEIMQLDLTVDLGTLSIADTAGASVISGDVNGDTNIVLQGSASDLNDALEQLWWTSADGQIADATLTVEADDLGNTGTGGDLTDQVTVTLRMESADTALLAHWTFDDGSGLVAVDSAGSYDATFNEAGTLSWIDGVHGGAAHLGDAGGRQEFSVPDSDSMQPAAFTISTWVNFDVPFHQMDGAYPFLLNHESWADKAGFSLGAHGDIDDLGLRGLDGVSWPTAVTYQYEAGEWLHVGATYDGTNVRIFIDGDLVASREATMDVHYVEGLPLSIGSDFEGALDEMRIYGRALRHDELIALAESNTAPTLVVNDAPTPTVDEDATGPAASDTTDGDLLMIPQVEEDNAADEEAGTGTSTSGSEADVDTSALEDMELFQAPVVEEQAGNELFAAPEYETALGGETPLPSSAQADADGEEPDSELEEEVFEDNPAEEPADEESADEADTGETEPDDAENTEPTDETTEDPPAPEVDAVDDVDVADGPVLDVPGVDVSPVVSEQVTAVTAPGQAPVMRIPTVSMQDVVGRQGSLNVYRDAPVAEAASLETFARQIAETMDEETEEASRTSRTVTVAVGTTTVLLSTGYMVWVVQTGLLKSAVLSSLPLWRWVDPLPILNKVKPRAQKRSRRARKRDCKTSDRVEGMFAGQTA